MKGGKGKSHLEMDSYIRFCKGLLFGKDVVW